MYEDIVKAIEDLSLEYDMFVENVLGVGKENPMGKEIRVYEVQVKYTEFMENKEELIRSIEKLRLLIMQEIPSAYEIHSKHLLDIEEAIIGLKDKGDIDEPLRIRLALNLLNQRIHTAVKLGDVERLLSEGMDFDKMAMKIFKDGLKKIAKKEKAYIIFDALIKHSSRNKPLSIFELSKMLDRTPEWVKSGLKEIREESPELLRIVMQNKQYKYYVPDVYKRYYIV